MRSLHYAKPSKCAQFKVSESILQQIEFQLGPILFMMVQMQGDFRENYRLRQSANCVSAKSRGAANRSCEYQHFLKSILIFLPDLYRHDDLKN